MRYDDGMDFICPGWILEGLQALRPSGGELVHEWADRCRVLDHNSAMPGPWRTSFTPYLADLMDVLNEPDVEEVSVVKPTQVGGTETLLNQLGYIVDCDPSPTMFVYPTESVGESVSDDRIRPMLLATPSLRQKFDRNSKRLDLQFDAMHVIIAGANSPSGLSSHQIRFLFMDEVDKYPEFSGKEADPRRLARERTKTFDDNKKIISVSTPTFENGPIWQDWLNADTQYEYYVTCPHCGSEWTWQFKQLKFSTESAEAAGESAVYVCPDCGGVINDNDKREMTLAGRWKAIRENGRRRIAYRLNTFASPWVRLGDIAREFVISKNDKAALLNFINSWLAEPYKEVESSFSAEWLLKERQGPYPMELVPTGTVMITGGVDVQKECFYWTVRAWRDNMTSFNLCHGKAFSWREVEHAMNRIFYDRQQNSYIVNLCCVDSGDQTDDVYDFCAINTQWAVPVKGASGRMQGRYKRSIIDRASSKANGMTLYIVDTNHYKDTLFARMRRDEDNGGWYMFNGVDAEYCEMLTAEQKVIKKYGGRLATVWELKATGRDNHYLDCEIYASLAADLCGLRDINAQRAQVKQEVADPVAPRAAQPPQETIPMQPPPTANSFFARRSGKWF